VQQSLVALHGDYAIGYVQPLRLYRVSVIELSAGSGFEITPVEISVKFDVETSVAIKGTFDKRGATLTFASPEVETAVLDIKIQADGVDTRSGMRNGKLKGKDFFDVEHNP
jgi:polyisoprenoid-binding protein YceI